MQIKKTLCLLIFHCLFIIKSLTPLHWASRYGYTEIIILLLKYGAECKSYNSSNYTPLMIAVQMGNYDAVKALVLGGADINELTSAKTNVLSYAKPNSFEQYFLICNGAY